MPIRLPERRTSDLRKGRLSQPGARYFVTFAVVRPSSVLIGGDCPSAVMTAASRCQEDRDIDLICATVMPDHVHMLFHLGERIALDRVVAKVKGLSSSALLSAGGRWQENFYEHRLRPDESQTPFIRYVFMNPYRSRLVGLRGEWPYWMSGRGSESLIGELDEGRYPPSEWLNESQELPEDLIGKD